MEIAPLHPKLIKRIDKYGLRKKFSKQSFFLKRNPFHPSLHLELLEPKNYGIYSFRIDRKFRAIFIIRNDQQVIEILNITSHYNN